LANAPQLLVSSRVLRSAWASSIAAPYDERRPCATDRNTTSNPQHTSALNTSPFTLLQTYCRPIHVGYGGTSRACQSSIVLESLCFLVCAGCLCDDKSLFAPAKLNAAPPPSPGAHSTHAPFVRSRCWHRASLCRPWTHKSTGLRPAAWDR